MRKYSEMIAHSGKIRLRILLIAFQKDDNNIYPHFKCIIEQLKKTVDLEYFYFRERGYFVDGIIKNKYDFKSYVLFARSLIYSSIDQIHLKKKRKKFDVVIAVDHYIYAVACKIFKNERVVFWSHDIIGKDYPTYRNCFIKKYLEFGSLSLQKHKKLIIQDSDRLELLKDSLHINTMSLDVFYLPIILNDLQDNQKTRVLSSRKQPRVIQSGGIGAYRYSDQLLDHYQLNSNSYRLYFHGYIFDETMKRLAKAKVQPMVSSMRVHANSLPQILDFADIGFIGYQQRDRNFYYIAFASGQLTEYLRLGMPVIVMGNSNLQEYVKDYQIGYAIGDFSEFNTALAIITDNYDEYSNNCFKRFEQFYSHRKYIPALIDWLRESGRV